MLCCNDGGQCIELVVDARDVPPYTRKRFALVDNGKVVWRAVYRPKVVCRGCFAVALAPAVWFAPTRIIYEVKNK